jgi:predicted Zn-dependent protease
LIDQFRGDEAVRLLRGALAGLPVGAEERFTRLYLRVLETRGRFLEAYQTAPDRATAFQSLANWLADDLNRIPELSRLLEARAGDDPDDVWLAYHRGKLLNVKGRHDEAVEQLEPLLDTSDEALQEAAFNEYGNACLAAGKFLELYEHAADPLSGFRRAAWWLSDGKRPEELAALIARHKQRCPDDSWPAYYEARSLVSQGRYQEAMALLRPLAADDGDEALTWQARSLQNEARLKAGQLEQAYQDAPDKDAAFQSLAMALSDEIADADSAVASQAQARLEQLLTLHKETRPDGAEDTKVSIYRARLLAARGKLEQAAGVLEHAVNAFKKSSGDVDGGADGADNTAADNTEADNTEEERA